MPGVARKSGTDSVSTGHGCDANTTTDIGSDDVFVDDIGVVRLEDTNTDHAFSGRRCQNRHSVSLSVASETVFVNDKGIGRVGDKYGDETIESGSETVFAD